MKTQRDQLLDILASGMAFKCSIVLDFDVRQERIDAATVPADVHKETQRMLETSRELIEDQNRQIDKLSAAKHVSLTPDVSAGITTEKPDPIPEPETVVPDKSERKTKKRGMGVPQLGKSDVWAVRRYLAKGKSNAWIAKQVDCSPNVVWRVKSGLSYKNVPPEPHQSVTNIHAGHGVVKQGKKK